MGFYKPSPFYQVVAFCIDDTPPKKFIPDNWIQKNHCYWVKQFADSLNTNELAITITDAEHNEIRPSEDVWSFMSERFQIFFICLN